MKNQGIALVSALLIMVAVMVLGFGSMFLTQMNLRISENSRSNAAAKNHADAGIDTAIVLLTQHYKQTGAFPTNGSFTLPVTANQSYSLLPGTDGYRRDSSEQARVRVEGFTANNARYIAEVLMGTASEINRAFLIGMASERTIRITGGGQAEFVNSGIHANDGVDLPGYSSSVFRECDTADQVFSTCQQANPLPVSSSNGTSCYMAGCDPWAEPIDIDPEYIIKRNDTIARAFGLTNDEGRPLYYRNAFDQTESDGRGGLRYADPRTPNNPITLNWEDNSTIYDDYCTVVYGSGATPPANITAADLTALKQQAEQQAQAGLRHNANVKICAKDGLSLNFETGINMSNVLVLADGNITFGGACSPTVDSCGGTAGELKSAGHPAVMALVSRNRLNTNGSGTLNALTQPGPNGAEIFNGRGGAMLNTVRGINLSIFTGANRNITKNLNGSQQPYYLIGSGFNLSGDTTIASNRNITFQGQTQISTYPDKPAAVTVAIISTRQIENNGSSDFYGVFWAGTGFTQNGSSKTYGSIAVKNGDIKATGKLHINTSYAVDNSNLYDPATAQVVSRR